MTGEGPFFTNSQEAVLLQEWSEFKDQIDIDSFQFPMANLSQEISEPTQFINTNHYEDPASADSKYPLQQTIAMAQQVPNTITPILGKEEFAGPLNFQLILNYQQNSGKHWIYSERLSKVFIHMEEVLPVQFQWTPPMDGLWVRATMVYKLDQHRSQPVTRCHNHMAPDNNSNRNIDIKHLKHVIRCLHNTSTYDENLTNGHLSVLVPLGTPEAGVNNVPMDFRFFCKNSCTSGMNRRATEVIFTLENDKSQILGRRKLEVRVCSCPKRDKEKEENEGDSSTIGPGKKRKSPSSAAALPAGKKVATDNKVYSLNLNILGKENAQAVLKFAYDVMAGASVKSGNYEHYKPYMDEILKKNP